ncbi:hypothetical protein MHYP_G00362290 [Metynnis hypsauchen]
MLVRVKYKTEQKYIKITDVTLQSFLKLGCSKFNIKEELQKDLKVYDESGTEIEDDVFEDLLKDPNCGILKLVAIDETQVSPDESLNSSADLSSCDSDETVIMPPNKRQRQECKAESMIENILLKKPGGDRVIKEYTRTKMLTDATRRQMVNILTAEMTETHGTSPPRDVRELYAKGIVSLFPYLKDPYSKNGYEHYYDSESGSGYLAWRLKTIQRKASTESPKPSSSSCLGGPTSKRPPSLKIDSQLNEDQIREAVSLMKHSSDEALVKQKMRLTFSYRQKMVHDPQKCSDMLSVFPRFKDVKGLIEQDFVLLFGESTSAKFLEKWPTAFKDKVIHQSKGLSHSREVQELIEATELTVEENQDEVDLLGWDSDLSSLILLLHLLPPSAQGRKKPGKMSVTQATGYLVVFIKEPTFRNISTPLKTDVSPIFLQLRAVARWTDQSVETLQDALDDVDWDMFQYSSDGDLHLFADSVVSFVGKLVDDSIPKVIVRSFPNQKPWVDKTIRDALSARTAAYNEGLTSENMEPYKSASYGVRRAYQPLDPRSIDCKRPHQLQ